jgi:hypothetical protein
MLIIVDVAQCMEQWFPMPISQKGFEEAAERALALAEKKAGELAARANCDAVVVWQGVVHSVVQFTVNEDCGWVATRVDLKPRA